MSTEDPLMKATEAMASAMAGFTVQYNELKKKVAQTVVATRAKKELEVKLAKVKEVIGKLS